MSQLVKFSAAAALVLAGFFSASLLGPPDHLASLREEPDQSGQLVPIEAHPATPGLPSVGSGDEGVTPAGFTNPHAPGFATSVRAAHYPDSPGSDGGWARPGASESTVPEVGGTGEPPWNLAAPQVNRELVNLDPAPQLGDFDRPPSPPAPAAPASALPTTPESAPQATFAHQPANEPSPWTDRASAGHPSAPLPWSTAGPAATPERAPTALHTPSAEDAVAWAESRGSRSIRWHVVSDGDSLPRLAQRYLNDASRGGEIFEENRNVLSDPEILPIGVQLRIPESPPTPTAVQVYDAHGAAHAGIQARRLVELPEVSPTATAAPVARLRAPQFAGSTN